MELLVSCLDAGVLQQNAPYVAAVYAAIAEPAPPQTLLDLRISLRKRSLERPDDAEHQEGDRPGDVEAAEGTETRVKQRKTDQGHDQAGQSQRPDDSEEAIRKELREEEQAECRQQHEDMQNEEAMMDIALHEAYEEELVMEAYEEWEKGQREKGGDCGAATAIGRPEGRGRTWGVAGGMSSDHGDY